MVLLVPWLRHEVAAAGVQPPLHGLQCRCCARLAALACPRT